MAIIATQSGGGDYKNLDPGTYIARCISVWSIGTQYNKWHDTWKPQIILRWEIPEELDDDGKPCTISAFYSLSLHEKANLYKALIAWRGKKFTDDELARFDVTTVLDAPCLLTVTHSDEGKQKVAAVAKLGKGMSAPPATHELTVYDPFDDPGGSGYAALPEWVQSNVDKSRERMPVEGGGEGYQKPPATPAEKASAEAYGDDDSEIPF